MLFKAVPQTQHMLGISDLPTHPYLPVLVWKSAGSTKYSCIFSKYGHRLFGVRTEVFWGRRIWYIHVFPWNADMKCRILVVCIQFSACTNKQEGGSDSSRLTLSGLTCLRSLSSVVCAALKEPQPVWFTVTVSFQSQQ